MRRAESAGTARGLLMTASLLAILAAAPGSMAHDARNNATGVERHTLKAVIPLDSPPTYYRDEKTGKAAGFAVDIMRAVAERAGLHVDFEFEEGWEAIINRVKTGNADLSPGMGVSKEREKDLAFSSPIDAFPISFFTREEHAGIDVTPGVHTVGVIRGSVAFEKLQGRSDLRLALYEGFPQGLFDLLAGRIEAFACPAPTLWQLARETGVEDHIKIVDKPIAEITRAIAVRKDHRELLERLNTEIVSFVGTPAYQQIYMKWYGRPKPYWTELRIIAVGAAALLVIIVLMAGWRYLSILRLNRELTKTIAQRKEIETALSAREAVLRSFLNAITESAMLIDREGRVLTANETVAQRLGTTVPEIVGRSAYDFLPPDVARRRKVRIDALFRTGVPEQFEDERSGRIIDSTIYPVFDPPGLVSAAAIIGIDITERMQAVSALDSSEKKYRMLYDAAIDAIFIVDMDGNLIDFNRTAHERLGYTRDELLALHLSQLDLPDFAGQVGARIGQLRHQGNLIFTSAHRRKDGAIMPVEINARVIEYDGRPAIFSIVRDISERKLAEQEREKLIADLQKAFAEIKTLHGILPICSSCKKVRDDKGAWHQMEVYIRDHTDAEFSHGLCADCAKRLYPGYSDKV